MTTLCTFVSKDRIPCPAYAAPGSVYCPVHRDHEFLELVRKPGPRHTPVICADCGDEIRPGTMQRHTERGPIHAAYTCLSKRS